MIKTNSLSKIIATVLTVAIILFFLTSSILRKSRSELEKTISKIGKSKIELQEIFKLEKRFQNINKIQFLHYLLDKNNLEYDLYKIKMYKGHLLAKKGRIQEAIICLEEAIVPESKVIFRNRNINFQLLCSLLDHGKEQEVIQHLKQVESKFKNKLRPYYVDINLLIKQIENKQSPEIGKKCNYKYEMSDSILR